MTNSLSRFLLAVLRLLLVSSAWLCGTENADSTNGIWVFQTRRFARCQFGMMVTRWVAPGHMIFMLDVFSAWT
jgi:hypothetical protein